MTTFPDGVQTREDAIRLLRHIDGQETLVIDGWDIDDFISVPRSDPVVNRCRIRVRDELIDLLASYDPGDRERIPVAVNNILNELTDASN
jgi:hypothetical protein